VNQYYADENFVPKEVLVPYAAAEAEALGDVLSEAKGERVKVLVPQRGDKVELLKLAVKNAERSFGERSKSREEVEVVLERLMARLHLKRLPRRMECFESRTSRAPPSSLRRWPAWTPSSTPAATAGTA